MNENLLMILIGLMSLTLLTLAWAVIALLLVARRELPKLQRQVSELNGRFAQLLDELIPTVQQTTLALKEAHRALHEAAETIENVHIVSDNIRHKLEVADAVGAKVRRLPEKAARLLGRLMHQGFKLGGQLLSAQIEKRLQSRRATVYDGARGLDTPVQADTHSGLGVSPKQERGLDSPVRAEPHSGLGVSPTQERGLDSPVRAEPHSGLGVSPRQDGEDAVVPTVSAGGDARAAGEAITHTTHKEG